MADTDLLFPVPAPAPEPFSLVTLRGMAPVPAHAAGGALLGGLPLYRHPERGAA